MVTLRDCGHARNTARGENPSPWWTAGLSEVELLESAMGSLCLFALRPVGGVWSGLESKYSGDCFLSKSYIFFGQESSIHASKQVHFEGLYLCR